MNSGGWHPSPPPEQGRAGQGGPQGCLAFLAMGVGYHPQRSLSGVLLGIVRVLKWSSDVACPSAGCGTRKDGNLRQRSSAKPYFLRLAALGMMKEDEEATLGMISSEASGDGACCRHVATLRGERHTSVGFTPGFT